MSWRESLKNFQTLSTKEQQENKDKIISEFEKMMDEGVDRQTFGEYMDGIVLFPEIMFEMYDRVNVE